MAADPQRLFLSVEEYLELDRKSLDARYEYIDGVVTMLAGGTTNHSRISINVVSLLQAALRGSRCEVFNSDLRVSISSKRYVLPDASVSCEPEDLRGENDIIYSPCVIVEVLSPSTEATDRGRKFRYYQSCSSIQEYVLISTQEQAVDVYRRASDNLWTLHPFGPGDEIELKSIDVSIPLEALYENVTVPAENAEPTN
jgi:Uma2 family endonuclease